MIKKIIALVVFVVIFISFTEMSKTIPAFARKYKLSCQTCHSPVPRLKAYGDEFAGNGFKLADKEASRYFVETGDEELSLIRDFPLAVRFDGHLTYNNGDKENADFGAPYILKLLSGGELANDLSYYFYFYMDERGEIVGVEDCYIMFNNLFGTDLDLYIGQFQVSDPLFKRELRLTLEDYQIYKSKPGLSKMNLAYDRGIMLTYGLDTGTDFMFEVINGAGLGDADADKLFDIDGHKSFMGRITQDVGDFLRIGAFVYSGKEDLANDSANVFTNSSLSFGPDLTLSVGDKLQLNLQYVQRKDDELLMAKSDLSAMKDVETKGAMAELIFTPDGDNSKWYAAGVFNWVESDHEALNYKTAAVHAGYMLRRNLRLCLEGNYNFSIKDNEFMKFSLGFVGAF